jgi:hypothetical protein
VITISEVGLFTGVLSEFGLVAFTVALHPHLIP